MQGCQFKCRLPHATPKCPLQETAVFSSTKRRKQERNNKQNGPPKCRRSLGRGLVARRLAHDAQRQTRQRPRPHFFFFFGCASAKSSSSSSPPSPPNSTDGERRRGSWSARESARRQSCGQCERGGRARKTVQRIGATRRGGRRGEPGGGRVRACAGRARRLLQWKMTARRPNDARPDDGRASNAPVEYIYMPCHPTT